MEDRGSIKLAGTLLLSCGLVLLCAVSCVATRANDFGNALPITDGLSRVAGYNARVKPSSYALTHTRQPSIINTAPRGGSKPGQLILSAIAQVETGDNPNAIGKAGERGRHQLSAAAWKHSGLLLGCWCVRRPSARELLSHTAHEDVHAAAYMKFLTSYLTTSGCEITPAKVSAAWNLGPREFRRRGFSLHRCPSAVRDYAKRVENLTKQ